MSAEALLLAASGLVACAVFVASRGAIAAAGSSRQKRASRLAAAAGQRRASAPLGHGRRGGREHRGLHGWITRDLHRARLSWTPTDYAVVSLATAVLFGGTALLLTRAPGAMLAAAAAGLAVQPLVVRRIAAKRSARFAAQVADTIEVVAASLRAGFGLTQSLELAAREQADPMASELRQVIREAELGIGIEEALTRLVARTEDDDLDLAVQAVLVLRRSGGDVGDVLARIAETVRNRLRVRGEVRTLTAQMQMSAWIVGLLPVGIASVTLIMQPEQISVLFTNPAGRAMAITASIMEVLGFIIVRRIAAIRY